MDQVYYDLIKNQFIFKNIEFKNKDIIIKDDVDFLQLASILAMKNDVDSFKNEYLNYVMKHNPNTSLREANIMTTSKLIFWAKKLVPNEFNVIVSAFMKI